MNFKELSVLLRQTHDKLFQSAVKAVNINLSIRNWLFGFYIVEFEQNGEDRAKYGKKLLFNLAEKLSIKGLTAPELSRCRQFYNTYPQIRELITKKLSSSGDVQILGTLSQISTVKNENQILGTPSQELYNMNDSSCLNKLLVSASFSHFVELIKIDEPVKRNYYELLIIKTTPSVRELQKQIASLSFERLGLSSDKDKAFLQIRQKINPESSTDLVKTHYFFDFLNIRDRSFIEENELEEALLNHLQEFIIELGNGFCFEARQKRILIDDEYYFIDLVFYHRILKCHVLIELKTDYAKHEHIGQLRAYLQYYKRNITAKDDNPPVGILLVTEKNKTLVEYAIADSDKEIFVSKYKLQLPAKKELESFIKKELENYDIRKH